MSVLCPRRCARECRDGPIRNLERPLQSGLPVPRVPLAEPLQHDHDCRPATGITDPCSSCVNEVGDRPGLQIRANWRIRGSS